MDRVSFVTPVGRIVAGSVSVPNTKNMKGQPLTTQNGEPRVEFFFALAVEKSNPEADRFRALLGQVAQQAWPGGQFRRTDFSWKMDDGDGTDREGKPFAAREGYKGCWVFKFSGGFAPRCYRADGRGGMAAMEASEVQKGCFVRVSGNVVGNANSDKPGLYLNHDMIEWVAFGAPIYSGPDPSSVFTAPVGALPQGASASPVAGSVSVAAPMNGQYPSPGPGPAPAYGPGPGPAPAYGPGPGPAPAYGPGPAPAPAYGPGPAPAPAYGPGPGPAPAYGPGPAPAPAYGPGPAPAPAYGPGPGPAPAYGPGPGPAPAVDQWGRPIDQYGRPIEAAPQQQHQYNQPNHDYLRP